MLPKPAELVTFWSGPDDAWLSLTPEGYYCGSEALLEKGTWRATGKPVTDAKLLAPLNDATKVGKAAIGEKLTGPIWK